MNGWDIVEDNKVKELRLPKEVIELFKKINMWEDDQKDSNMSVLIPMSKIKCFVPVKNEWVGESNGKKNKRKR